MEEDPHRCAGSPEEQPLLLSVQDPDPVTIINARGRSRFLMTGDHAGKTIPAMLGTLGLAEEDRVRHIAWDIGVAPMAEILSALLDATFVAQNYSRLVIDCNRDPYSAEAIPVVADGTRVPGNEGLEQAAHDSRIAEIHAPYQASLADIIATRMTMGIAPIQIALHSFTPSLSGVSRPWHVGILHGEGRTDFARALLETLSRNSKLMVGDNEPYRMDETDYTIPRHAFVAGLAYAEIDVRQDLISDATGQHKWAEILASAFREAAAAI